MHIHSLYPCVCVCVCVRVRVFLAQHAAASGPTVGKDNTYNHYHAMSKASNLATKSTLVACAGVGGGGGVGALSVRRRSVGI